MAKTDAQRASEYRRRQKYKPASGALFDGRTDVTASEFLGACQIDLDAFEAALGERVRSGRKHPIPDLYAALNASVKALSVIATGNQKRRHEHG